MSVPTSLPTWVILGATSIIAQEFAHLAAQHGHSLVLVGRHFPQLEIIAADIHLRYKINCDCFQADLNENLSLLLTWLKKEKHDLNLFLAHSLIYQNAELTEEKIAQLIQVNITSSIQIIQTYLKRQQKTFIIGFISSMAAIRGRSKNSLYGASKAALETYLQGLEQQFGHLQVTIGRLGFIDTIQTYGQPGIFHAADPKDCALICWKKIQKRRRLFYYPLFWRFIGFFLRYCPFYIYRKLGKV